MRENDVRETPRAEWNAWNREFRFDLDAAATHQNTLCPMYFTEAGLWHQAMANGIPHQDGPALLSPRCGLAGTWRGRRVWCNPPFSELSIWLAKAWREFDEHGGRIVMLVPAWTDRPWWHEHVEPFRGNGGGFKVRFLPGRTHFTVDGGKPICRRDEAGELVLKNGKPQKSSPTFGCALLIWGS